MMSKLNFKQRNPTEKSCLSLVNHLIKKVSKSLPEVKSIHEINSNLIVLLYQEATGNILSDLLVCEDSVGDIRNVEAVINALSEDALGIPLSHITGEEIVAGNLDSIFDLLQILESVLLYLPTQENEKKILKRKIGKRKEKNSVTDFSKMMPLPGKRKHLKKSPLSSCHKSYLLPYPLRRRSKRLALSKQTNSKNQSYNHYRDSKLEILKTQQEPRNFIELFCSEFPGIYIPPKSKKQVNEQYEKHLMKMHDQIKTHLLQKCKTTIIQGEETEKRQQIISNIAKKEAHKQQYLKELKEQKKFENKIKYGLMDSRLKAIQMKECADKFHEEMKQIQQKQSFFNEMIFNRAFKEIVHNQKYHVDTLCKQIKEAEDKDAKNYLNHLTFLENLYHNETLTNKNKKVRVKSKADKQISDKMDRDFQRVLKKEIQCMQKALVDLTDDQHFLQMDTKQFMERIKMHYEE